MFSADFLAHSDNFIYLCSRSSCTGSPDGDGWEGYIYMKRRYWRLVFDTLKSRKFHQLVKKQSNRNAPWVDYIQPWQTLSPVCYGDRSVGSLYIPDTWGFRCCSFWLTGQCESLKVSDGQQEVAPRFFRICTYAHTTSKNQLLPEEGLAGAH